MEDNFLKQVKELWDQKLGSRAIAEKLGTTRHQVQKAYKELGIYNSGRNKPCKPLPIKKTCKTCKETKEISEFRERPRNGKTYYEPYCHKCELEHNRKANPKRYLENKEWHQEYCLKNKDKRNTYSKQYYRENKQDILKQKAKRRRERRREDPSFRLRERVSIDVWEALSKQGKKKNQGTFESLPYSSEELKSHLESQFEDWMSWENWGRYNSQTWDDNDPNTWTWQIDHIVPQSKLLYKSLKDDNFKKCWSLDNLRPISSLENLLKSNKL